jgi:hypothetical protein
VAAMSPALQWITDGLVVETSPGLGTVLRGTRVIRAALEGRDGLVAGVDAALETAIEAAVIPALQGMSDGEIAGTSLVLVPALRGTRVVETVRGRDGPSLAS